MQIADILQHLLAASRHCYFAYVNKMNLRNQSNIWYVNFSKVGKKIIIKVQTSTNNVQQVFRATPSACKLPVGSTQPGGASKAEELKLPEDASLPRKLELEAQDSPTAQCTSFAGQIEVPTYSSCLLPGLPIDVEMTIMLSALRYVCSSSSGSSVLAIASALSLSLSP